jgi:hypothetical protein
VDIHRNWKSSVRGPVYLVLAVILLFAPQILAAIGYELVLGNWVAYVLAALSALAGIYSLVLAFRAYAVRIDDKGVTWTQGSHTISFAWSDVVRASVERKPNAPKRAKPQVLTVWTPDAVQYPVQPHVKLEGLYGYRIADMAEIR